MADAAFVAFGPDVRQSGHIRPRASAPQRYHIILTPHPGPRGKKVLDLFPKRYGTSRKKGLGPFSKKVPYSDKKGPRPFSLEVGQADPTEPVGQAGPIGEPGKG